MPRERLEQLIRLLQELLDLNRRLLALSERKRTMLTALDLDGLHAVMRAHQDLSTRILVLEESERELVTSLLLPDLPARPLGRDVLLRRVIEHAPDPARSRLELLRSELLDVLCSLTESHTTSRIVSRKALSRFQGVFEPASPDSNPAASPVVSSRFREFVSLLSQEHA